jgi:hypothetical protein
MLDANYIKHFKALGKMCKMYDDAVADETAAKTLRATMYDQIADGTDASAWAVDIISSYRSRINNAISNGPTQIQGVMISLASAYLVNDGFVDDLTTQPASRTAANVLAALQTEMGAGVDDKTLKTKSSTGLVNFFDAILGEAGVWNTDNAPDYDDSVYVVSAVI